MLVEFSIENYRSFKDMVTFSMEASVDKINPQNVVYAAQGTKFNLLKSAFIYGANASGKSNLISAFRTFREIVNNSKRDLNEAIPVTPFKLDQTMLNEPTTFEIVFLHNGIKYIYGFSVNAEYILEEWYYSFPYNRKRVLFERKTVLSDPKDGYYFGEHWIGEANRLCPLTKKNIPFITVAHQFNNETVEPVFQFVVDSLRFAASMPTGLSEENYTLKMCYDIEKVKDVIIKMLKSADLAITDIELIKRKYSELKQYKSFPKSLMNALAKELDMDITDFEKHEKIEFSFLHKAKDIKGEEVYTKFSPEEESDGTRKYFALAGPVLSVIWGGKVLLTDELDIQLHPLLTQEIIQTFHNNVNDKGAQLIAAIHDVNLLSRKELLRRDQIWFTSRQNDGSTDLYSAWDYRPRKGEKLDKNYLAGRYGAIPYVENILR